MKTLATLALLMTSSLASAFQNPEALVEIDQAANKLDFQSLNSLVEKNTGYSKAYAEYRLAITSNISGRPQSAMRALEQASVTLEQLSLETPDSEVYALLAAVYGMQISLKPARFFTLANRSSQALEHAEKLNPTNPRVYLVKTIRAFHTPALFGGGMTEAVDYSNQALDYFSDSCTDICWGKAETYTWRGLAKLENNREEAIADWQKALEVDSNFGWAQFLIGQNQEKTASQRQ